MGSTAVSSSGASPAGIYHHLEAAHTITMERRATTYASFSQGPQDHKYDSDTSEIHDQMSEIFAGASSPQGPQDHIYDSDTSAQRREIVAGAASSSQDAQPQHHNFYNWPNLDLLPSKCDHSYEYHLKCVPLHNAALKGDWEEAKRLLLTNHIYNSPLIMLRTAISERYETALHVATGAKQIAFVLEIIELMEPEDLTLQDLSGNTAFYLAAATGTIEIAEAMLTRNSALLSIRGSWNMTPLYTAVLLGKMEMATLLYDRTIMYLLPDDKAYLFFQSILTDLYDMALKLLKNRPELAVFRDENNETALHVLARKPSSIFNSNLLKNFISSCPVIESLKMVSCLFGDFKILEIFSASLKNLILDSDDINDGLANCEIKVACPSLVSFDFLTASTWNFTFQDLNSLQAGEDNVNSDAFINDDMIGMITEAIGFTNISSSSGSDHSSRNEHGEGPNDETTKFLKFLQDAESPLYPGCEKFTQLSFIVRLLHLKVLSGWTNKSFTLLLELLKEAMPSEVKLPSSYYDAQKITVDLGFTYKTWDACPKSSRREAAMLLTSLRLRRHLQFYTCSKKGGTSCTCTNCTCGGH
ncbi:hypothetical protein EZV62_000492 [Acer yangbiense]|uniref:Uncharacterized protein n=1 Tax=Acer yangbiense TaxID=1000413 RepID=A0A5C7IRB1_9ROSI|nr:hypothetical protein EZV62_000492 [Acer yangbiense]